VSTRIKVWNPWRAGLIALSLALILAAGVVVMLTEAGWGSPGYDPAPRPSLAPPSSVTRSPVWTISPAPTAITAPPSEHGTGAAATLGICQ